MRQIRFRFVLLIGVVALTGSLVGLDHAFSQPVKKGGSQASEQAPAAAPAGAASVMSSTAQVEGFRSARFGMTEADTRAAIMKDFKVKADAIREQPNPSERTRALLVKVPDLLPGGGAAEVSYVIGYQSKN